MEVYSYTKCTDKNCTAWTPTKTKKKRLMPSLSDRKRDCQFFFFLGGGKMLDDFGFKNVVLERWLPYHYVIIFHVYIYTYIYLCVVHMILGYYALKTVYHITLIYFQNFRRSSLLTKMIHYFISKG